eukprot:Nitzschia sp. Nitz4//scaffold124_size66437//10833//11237//NITZ4_006103-RA/size66437-processed-gene-0.36-mRNA-1//1//CDS//3329534528//3767//frame0
MSVGLCCFKMKEKAHITALEYKISSRQQKFGVDYLTLVQQKAPQGELKRCLKEAMGDVQSMRHEANDHKDAITAKEQEVETQKKKKEAAAAAAKAEKEREADLDTEEPPAAKPAKKKKPKKKKGADERFTIDDD